ncbi:MAG: hypothetical protein GDA47_05390, partial [Rhodospirillales bacterium]|nr:hypothetical protein [Rhodospirillales bacterium]
MDFENYSERARGFLQDAQTRALGEGHQRLVPEHLLKVIIDDREGLAANLIKQASGDPLLAKQQVEQALARLPQVTG